MKLDLEDFELPSGVVLPRKETLWAEEQWDRWVLDRFEDLVASGAIDHSNRERPRNFEALDLEGIVLQPKRG